MTGHTALLAAVLGTGVLAALAMIVSHEMAKSTLNILFEDEVVQNFTSMFFAAFSPDDTMNATVLPQNTTALSTILPDYSSEEPPTAQFFYLYALPRRLFLVILLCPLQYYWHIGLEFVFPTRPRNVEVHYDEQPEQTPGEKKLVDGTGDGGPEEEVVKRWIAKGRVRQSAVSWRNTLSKWVLHMWLGTLWYEMAWYFLNVYVVPGPVTYWRDLYSHMWYMFLISFVSTKPLLSLISFVRTPAPRRVLLEGAGTLMDAICYGAVLQLVVSRLLGSSFLQDMLDFVAENLEEVQVLPVVNNDVPLHLIDEL